MTRDEAEDLIADHLEAILSQEVVYGPLKEGRFRSPETSFGPAPFQSFDPALEADLLDALIDAGVPASRSYENRRGTVRTKKPGQGFYVDVARPNKAVHLPGGGVMHERDLPGLVQRVRSVVVE